MLIRWLKTERWSEELRSKVLEVLQKIKILLEIAEPKNSFSISLNPNPDEREMILRELEKKEKILKINRLNKSTNSASITVVNKRKFKSFYEKVERGKRGPDKNLKSKINEIICVRPNLGNKFIVVLNNDYRNFIKGDRAKSSWDFLFRIAEGEEIPYNVEYKNCIDYFNSNSNNRIYTQTGCKVTKIFKIEGGYIRPNIKMNVISEKALKRRIKKTEKQLKNT